MYFALNTYVVVKKWLYIIFDPHTLWRISCYVYISCMHAARMYYHSCHEPQTSSVRITSLDFSILLVKIIKLIIRGWQARLFSVIISTVNAISKCIFLITYILRNLLIWGRNQNNRRNNNFNFIIIFLDLKNEITHEKLNRIT